MTPLNPSIRVFKNKSKNAQEAHECIRPVDINEELDDNFTDNQKKLFNLIKKRTIIFSTNVFQTIAVALKYHLLEI